MRIPSGTGTIAFLLSFNAGFVDTAGFLGLHGLFPAHVTGNFVTLGAALALGGKGVIGKLLALPAFILVIALARLAGAALRTRDLPVLRILLTAKLVLLACFFSSAVWFGPFPHGDTPAALLTSFAGIAAMALQNALQRVHLAHLPPTTMVTGSVTQATMDAIDLLTGAATPEQRAATRTRFRRVSLTIVYFAAGCAASATLYAYVGLWGLLLPTLVAAAAALMQIEQAPRQV